MFVKKCSIQLIRDFFQFVCFLKPRYIVWNKFSFNMRRNVANWFHHCSFTFSLDKFYISIASDLLMDEAIRFIQIDYSHKYCLYYFVYEAQHFSESPDDILRKTRRWWSHISGTFPKKSVVSFYCSRAGMAKRLALAREQLETYMEPWSSNFLVP